ncbi:hypothetical protein ACFQV2_03265 [Actinokineospora soli]|uniref:Uncharacterized protein n=1 Tax=Actinokineospora soli TaxID=1048753 RepID=A0ABW2TH95_9PSEU
MTLSPTSGSTWQGGFTETRVSATGGTGSLTLSASGLPTGARAQFNPQTIAQGGASTVWFWTSSTTPRAPTRWWSRRPARTASPARPPTA